ncbi:MAG: flagellar motor protein MotB [Archangium sp.]|nr:flagellar motor protein MotB [Archangium sp.]
MRRTIILPLIISVAAVGCVTQSTYDALKLESDRTASTLGAREKELEETRRALKKEEAKAAALGARMAELEAALGDTQKDKSALENALVELRKRKAETEGRIAEFKALLDKFKTLIDSGKLKVRIREGRMVVELATDILFPSGSATLSKEGKVAIAEVAELLKSIPDRKFQVEGHTDNVPTKGPVYKSNWELASARALTVLKAMTDAGMPGERISAASFGDTAPAKPNDTAEDKAANRRIEIVLVPDLSSLPGFDELQRVAP